MLGSRTTSCTTSSSSTCTTSSCSPHFLHLILHILQCVHSSFCCLPDITSFFIYSTFSLCSFVLLIRSSDDITSLFAKASNRSEKQFANPLVLEQFAVPIGPVFPGFFCGLCVSNIVSLYFLILLSCY